MATDDDGDPSAGRERAARDNRDLQGLEVVGRHDVPVGLESRGLVFRMLSGRADAAERRPVPAHRNDAGDRRTLHARLNTQPREQLIDERPRGGRRVAPHPEIEEDDIDALRPEPRIDLGGTLQRPEEERRRDEQDERHRHLADDEHAADADVADESARVALDERRQLDTGRAKGWKQAKGEAGQQRQAQADGEDALIQTEVHHDGDGQGREEGAHERGRPPRQQQAAESAQHEDGQRFGEQLTNQPRPSGAERETNRQLAAPGGGSRQQHAGHVAAGNHHDQAGEQREHRHEQADRSLQLARESVGWGQLDALPPVGVRVIVRQPFGEHGHRCLRHRHRHGRAEPGERHQPDRRFGWRTGRCRLR